MKDELTPAELNLAFYGTPPKVEVEFYSKEVLDTGASKAAGHRVMKVTDYIHLNCVREKSEIHRPVQLEDQSRYASDWAAYEERKHGLREIQDVHPERPQIGAAFATQGKI